MRANIAVGILLFVRRFVRAHPGRRRKRADGRKTPLLRFIYSNQAQARGKNRAHYTFGGWATPTSPRGVPVRSFKLIVQTDRPSRPSVAVVHAATIHASALSAWRVAEVGPP